MENLILTLKDLVEKYEIESSGISFGIDFYYVDIKIKHNKKIDTEIKVTIFLHRKDVSNELMKLPDSLSEKIVNMADRFFSGGNKKPLKKIKNVNEYFDFLKQKESLIIEEYKKNIILTENQIYHLHMFFSPGLLPLGLTNEEILICVYLYHLREVQKRLYKIPPFLNKKFKNAVCQIMNDLAKDYNDHL